MDKLRLNHGALAALLVPAPASVVAVLRSILKAHNSIEEGLGSSLRAVQRTGRAEAGAILDALRKAPEIILAPHNDGPAVIEATRRALAKAGYNLKV